MSEQMTTGQTESARGGIGAGPGYQRTHALFVANVILALDSLRAHKLRAFLTLLGVIIGVAAVIGMMAIIKGIQLRTEREMTILQSSVFQVQKWPMIQTHGDGERRSRRNILPEYAEAIRERCSAVTLVGPEVWEFGISVAAGDRSTEPAMVLAGATPEFFPNNGYFINEGRAISYAEVAAHRRVAVIGTQVAEELFPFADPIGQEIRVSHRTRTFPEGDDLAAFAEMANTEEMFSTSTRRFEVIGVIEEQGAKFGGRNEDNRVAIPFTTFEELYGGHRSVNITIQARSPELVPVAMDQVTEVMRRERGLRPTDENDFEFYSTQMGIDFFNNMTRNIKVAAIAICAMSLLVAGIGIMNIMLVSVRERTREIGIRKAIGARKSDILLQFVTEAVLLSEVGGAIGVAAGIGMAALAAALVPALEAAVPVWAVVLGLGFCSLVGLFFGIYPASRAARLDPILALRDE
jgi:putative ABC transport system permease protein